jgi:hypothetical protein
MLGLQTQLPTSVPYYSGPIDAVTKIFKSDSLRGIYTGQGATMAREFHGYGMYFLAYEALVQRWCRIEERGRKVGHFSPRSRNSVSDQPFKKMKQ